VNRILIVLLLSLLCSPAWAATYTVCASGCDYNTVQGGVNAASDGDTVSVSGGPYAEDVVSHASGSSTSSYITIAGTGNPVILSITLSHNYNKVTSMKFLGNPVTAASHIALSGNYNWVEDCIIQGSNTVFVRGITYTGINNTVKSQTIKYLDYSNVIFLAGPNTYEGGTIEENGRGEDIFAVWGDGNIIKNVTMKHITGYGRLWAAGEALVIGQQRQTNGTIDHTCDNSSTTLCNWTVTTAGTTGESEPAGFDFARTATSGTTMEDGSVTWTLITRAQHPDLFQTHNGAPGNNYTSKNHIIDGNICVEGCNVDTLQIGNIEQKHGADIKDWTFRNNVFRVSRVFNIFAPGFKFHNNTFLGPALQATSPISLNAAITHGVCNNTIIKNNTISGHWDASESVGLYPMPTATAPKPTSRANTTAYELNDRIYTASPDGFHIWKCTTAGTTAGSEPAGYEVNVSITADATATSATLANVSTFTGYDAGHTDTNPHYYVVDWANNLSYLAHIDAVDEGEETITLSTAALHSGNGVSLVIVPDCTYKSITVTDGDAVFTCVNGYYGLDADYNHVAKGPENDYESKTGFAGVEAHGVNGGDPKFTSYTGTTKADFAIGTDSVLREAGADLSAVWSSSLDTIGTSRPQGPLWDIGAYEYPAPANIHGVTASGVTIQ